MAYSKKLIFRCVEAAHKRTEKTFHFILHGVTLGISEDIELRSLTLIGDGRFKKNQMYEIPIEDIDTKKKHMVLGNLN